MVVEPIAELEGMKFTKEEVDEIKDAFENSLKYYQLDDAPSDPETKTKNVEYAGAKIEIIESIKLEQ
jgi:hypothetical protein